MKESVELDEPELRRNSLILIGLTLRTFSTAVSNWFAPVLESVHEARPRRSPLKAAEPGVSLKVVLTVAPGATGSANLFPLSVVPETKEVHCLSGRAMLSVTPAAGAPVVFVNVAVMSCEDPGENVWTPGGVSVAEVGASVSRGTSYLAPTMLACTRWSVASAGNVPAAVIAPS